MENRCGETDGKGRQPALGYIFRPGTEADAPCVMALIEQRIAWMDRMEICQWNKSRYAEIYPVGYYVEAARQGTLYVLQRADGRIAAGAVVPDADKRWEGLDDAPACYVHNLVASIDDAGAGHEMLCRIESRARECGREYVRLDCAEGNDSLNGWYERQGYEYVGHTVDGDYHGNLRQKRL